MNTVNDLFAVVKTRREFEEAVESLRRQTKRNLPTAIICFAIAALWLWEANTLHGVTQKIEGKRVLLLDGVVDVIGAVSFIIIGVRCIYVSSRDRLLLLFVEDAISKKMAPNQAPEPTPTTVTPPARQAARQP